MKFFNQALFTVMWKDLRMAHLDITLMGLFFFLIPLTLANYANFQQFPSVVNFECLKLWS